jgi:hypothetical protein
VLLAVTITTGALVQVARVGWHDPAAGVPQGTVDRYGVPRGDPGAPVSVTIYEDFQCPFCAHMEAHVANLLTTEVDEGTVYVVYRPVAYLDHASTTDYSSRALNAAACTQNLGGVQAYVALHASLFANQPEEGSAGLSDEQLTTMAVDAGVSKSAVRRCIRTRHFADWGRAATNQASKDGTVVIPRVLVDGQDVKFTDREVPEVTLQREIDEAAGGTAAGAAGS